MRRRLLAAFAAMLAISAATPVSGLGTAVNAATGNTLARAWASPRVLTASVSTGGAVTALRFELSRPATVTVRIVDYRGRAVRTLVVGLRLDAGVHGARWDGRAINGLWLPNAGYRFRLTVDDGQRPMTVDRLIVKAASLIYPANTGAITVAIDPGHGGRDPGAIRGGFEEATANLDIGLRLRAMLMGAGVRVVMTRARDIRVNRRNVDWTDDGVVAYRDELASRIEVANAARADLFLVIHNNALSPGRGGTETWYRRDRVFANENRLLANLVHGQFLRQLRTLRTSRWRPIDRGIHTGRFYLLRPYWVNFCPRPSLMPAILGESLSLSHPYELRLLKSARGRQAIAEAYYEAVARYLALRRRGARYELLAAPASLIEGQPATVRTRITNTGPTSWPAGGVAATLAWLPAVPYYDGTNRPGTRLASIPIAEDVPPGGSVELELPFDAPSAASLAATGGAALLKVDLEGATDRFADHGVVPLQMPLLVTSLEPTPTPEPTPTREPTPTSTAGPAQQSGPEPSTEPTPAPSSGPSATLTASPSGGTAPAATPASTPEPIPEPTPTSTAGPAQQSGPEPSAEPTPAPAPEPTPAPTPEPTPAPTPEPTPIPEPTSTPTSGP